MVVSPLVSPCPPASTPARPPQRLNGRSPGRVLVARAAEAYEFNILKKDWDPAVSRSFTEQLQHTPTQGHAPVYLGNGSQPAALVQAPVCQKHAEPSAAALPGEWSDKVNWSLASFDDLMAHFSSSGIGSVTPDSPLCSIMQTDVISTHPDMPVANILSHFETVSMLPVVLRGDGRLVGVVARSDVQKRSGALVQDVMTRPPVAAQSHNRIHDAAVIMHKYKVSRLPIVDRRRRCVGFVSRSDIFQSLGAACVQPIDEVWTEVGHVEPPL